MIDRRLYFIINPISGKGRGKVAAEWLAKYCREHSIESKVCFTSTPGEATELSRQAAAEGFTDVIAVGGDGTANQVAAGIFGEDIRMGIFAIGTGNDLARTLSIPRSWQEMAAVIAYGKTTYIDVGFVNGRLFLNSTGTGLDAAVAADINDRRTKLSGFPAYFIFVIKELLTFKRQAVEIRFDGMVMERRPWLVAVTNGEAYGAGMKICPGANSSDGLLDICIVGDISGLLIPLYVPLIMAGKHRRLPKIEFAHAANVEIKTQGYWVQADGEVFKADNLEYIVVKQALAVLVPDA